MLAADVDRLPLNFLGLAAEPLVVEDLLDRFRVELPGTDSYGRTGSASLAEIARRWPVLLVIGAVGAVKNIAMRQLAAAWAADVEAPVPVVVPMQRLVKPLRDGEPLGLATVVDLGLGVDAPLAPVLVDRLRDGSAALLLDGLDECRDQQDAAVQLIRRLGELLHPSAGLVVSARDAVVAKAAATGLPVTRLAEPHHLASVARDILDVAILTARPGSRKPTHGWANRSVLLKGLVRHDGHRRSHVTPTIGLQKPSPRSGRSLAQSSTTLVDGSSERDFKAPRWRVQSGRPRPQNTPPWRMALAAHS